MTLPKALIYDIDGVICDSSNRIKRYVNTAAFESGDMDAYHRSFIDYGQNVEGDISIQAGIDLVRRLAVAYNVDRCFALTSRGDSGKDPTLSWLQSEMPFVVTENDLIMKPEFVIHPDGKVTMPDGSPKFCSVKYKRAETLKLLKDFEVVAALDDQAQICEMYQSLGILGIHVMHPNIDCVTVAGGADALALKVRTLYG